MNVILVDDVANLGRKGDVVAVADGYARNYLVPKGLALLASKGTLRQADDLKRARAQREERQREAAAAKVAVLGSSPVYISARAGEGERLFGSVTKSDIARAIQEQLGETVDRHKIRLEDPIRMLGTYQIEIPLHPEVNALVTVEVVPHEEDES